MKTIFQYSDYKTYLNYRCSKVFRERGLITRMAQKAGCQRSYLSQVLTKEAHLTTDQALGLAEFWGLEVAETDYFLILVEKGKAGTPKLKQHLEKKLEKLRVDQNSLKERTKGASISEQMKQKYYSSWYWAAIHMIVSAEEYQTTAQIAKRLNLKEDLVQRCLLELQNFGLVKLKGGKWQYDSANMHLEKSSVLNSIHHNNWRQYAIVKAQENDENCLNYSSVFTMSRADFAELRYIVLDFIDRSRKKISESGTEDIACLNCDLFWL